MTDSRLCCLTLAAPSNPATLCFTVGNFFHKKRYQTLFKEGSAVITDQCKNGILYWGLLPQETPYIFVNIVGVPNNSVYTIRCSLTMDVVVPAQGLTRDIGFCVCVMGEPATMSTALAQLLKTATPGSTVHINSHVDVPITQTQIGIMLNVCFDNLVWDETCQDCELSVSNFNFTLARVEE